ncbi:MAG TPA: glycosyltransferase family 4 protein [bacterium]|nr:glycosyltransferase family 4 protein [bacterium]
MKICHVITRLIVGGAQENTIFTVEGLVKKGYEVDLVSGPSTGPEGSLEPRIKEKGIPLIHVKEMAREINPVLDLITLIKLIILFRKKRYDVVHTHSAKAGILGRIASKIAKRDTLVIHSVHGLSFHEFQSPILNFIYITSEKIAAPFTDHFICVGEVMQEKSLQAGIGRGKKYSVIYSGFEIEPYREAEGKRDEIRQKLGIGENDKVIGMIGRLYHLKGQEYLLRAFAEIAAEFPETRLLLVGDGILRSSLEKYAVEKGVREKVIFTGLVHPKTIPGYVAAMDILAHTSLREGLPKAVAQGFAGGKAVVAFDVDGSRELVLDGRTGFLIPPKDEKLLREKLLYLLKNPRESYTMGIKGRERVEDLYPVHKMVDRIENIYMKKWHR